MDHTMHQLAEHHGSHDDAPRTRHWGRHAAWVTLSNDAPTSLAVAVSEIERALPGATVVVDLVDLDAFAAESVASLRASVESAVRRSTHVVLVASALEVRHALVTADVDHLAPMPQSRRDAMAFLRTVIQPLSA